MFRSRIRVIDVIFPMVFIVISLYLMVSFLNSSWMGIGIKVIFIILTSVFVLTGFYTLRKTIKTILRHREIIKNGYTTYGVVILEDCDYYGIGKFNVIYNIKVIMEDKSIRPFPTVSADSVDRVVLDSIQPGLIVKIKYYDDEILVMSFNDGINTSNEERELLERIRRTHGFNLERMWW